jgi:hypothetical protein
LAPKNWRNLLKEGLEKAALLVHGFSRYRKSGKNTFLSSDQ